MIDSILYSSRSASAVEQELNQVNDMLKMIEEVNEQLKATDGRTKQEEDGWFEVFLQTQNLWVAQIC